MNLTLREDVEDLEMPCDPCMCEVSIGDPTTYNEVPSYFVDGVPTSCMPAMCVCLLPCAVCATKKRNTNECGGCTSQAWRDSVCFSPCFVAVFLPLAIPLELYCCMRMLFLAGLGHTITTETVVSLKTQQQEDTHPY